MYEDFNPDSAPFLHLISLIYPFPIKTSFTHSLALARPTFLSAPEDVIGAPGDTINIQCQVEGDPPPTVRWTKQDGVLPQER